LKIREIRTADELQSLSGVWDTLLGTRGEEVIHSSFQWISTWWKYFGRGKKLFVLAAEDGNQIVGIAPLFLAAFRRKKILEFKRAYFLGEGLSDYGSFLVPRDKTGLYREFLRYLITSRAWHELRLQNIPDTRGDFDRLCEAGNHLGYKVDPNARAPSNCLYIDTKGSFQEYLKTTHRDVKSDVARRMKRIAEAGGFQVSFTENISLATVLEAAAEIHTKRQNELGRESYFQHPHERAFIEEITLLYHRRGWLDYVAMSMQGRIVAYRLGFRYGGVRFEWNVGFDPQYNKLSLGKVLGYLWVEDAFRREDITEFNFMRGDSEFKRKFTSAHRSNHHFIVPHPRSLYVRGLGFAGRWIARTGGRAA
jgi:CelD/BcsL family acetyltransferase involved in cellulose biosynthesis